MNLIGRRYGHIRVDRMLGQGGMGSVYEGVDEKLDRHVALKVLQHPNQRLDPEARTRLTREARTLGRLDHPNICRIYDFIDSDDADILVLELIDGRTLQEALREGLPRSEKLRVAQAIAEVLVVAHRAGILHRDLKPENVMLTKSGDVKVLDFGLARWLERERRISSKSMRPISPAELSAQLRVTDSELERWFALDADATAIVKEKFAAEPLSADATAAGITVGTPLYMSPEQARGESLTTASDLYSFGLLLQALFTEKDPYCEGTTAREVMLKAARGDSLPVTGVPRNITALIKALKAIAPADRPTAVDARRRLRYIVDAPKRYARRAIVAVLIIAAVFGVWKYTIDLRRERAAAQQAEAEARRRRAQADSLIGFMLGDLRTKLEPVGRLDILDDVAERSLAYMSSLRPESMSPEEIARNSKALIQLGDVRMSQGNLAAAIEVFRRSMTLAEAAYRRDSANPELELGLGTAHFWVGNALRLKGDLPHALAEMNEYRRIGEDLAQRYPRNDTYQLERGYGHSTVGTILETMGNLEGATNEYRVALEVKQSRLFLEPTDTRRQADVAVTLNKIGAVLGKRGDLVGARGYFGRELEMYSSLAAAEPKNQHWRERLASSHDFNADILDSLGKSAEALPHRAVAVELYRRLSDHDATNTTWRRNLVASLFLEGNTLRMSESNDEAIGVFAEAATHMQQLLQKDHARDDWWIDLAKLDIFYARSLLEARRFGEASSKIEAAIAALQAHGAKNSQKKILLADAFLVRGLIESAEGNRDPAQRSWQQGLEVVRTEAGSSDLVVLIERVELLLSAGRAADTAQDVTRLHSLGYRQADFERLLQHPE